jgi:TDG/mug DNA glycosylase family protein
VTRPVLPDLLATGLKLVFCGTAPSRASAAASAYYARPGNRFWPTLHAVGLTPRRFLPAEYPQLLALGIGLTDLAKHHSGNDDELPDDAFDVDALTKKLKRFAPAMVAFTSKNAARAYFDHAVDYGLQEERLGEICFFVLTSPSGQAVRFWDLACWRDLAGKIGPGNP